MNSATVKSRKMKNKIIRSRLVIAADAHSVLVHLEYIETQHVQLNISPKPRGEILCFTLCDVYARML